MKSLRSPIVILLYGAISISGCMPYSKVSSKEEAAATNRLIVLGYVGRPGICMVKKQFTVQDVVDTLGCGFTLDKELGRFPDGATFNWDDPNTPGKSLSKLVVKSKWAITVLDFAKGSILTFHVVD